MKNTGLRVKEKLIAKYLQKDTPKIIQKSIDVNVLLNRVKTNQRNEKKKKLYFSAAASTGLILFGLLIF